MTTYYKTINSSMEKIEQIEDDCWIDLVAPTEEELHHLSKKLEVDISFLKAPLDDEEASRIETEDGNTLIVIDIPYTEKQPDGGVIFVTIPLGVIILPKQIITVCLKPNMIINDILNGAIRNVNIALKTQTVLYIFLRAAMRYLSYLRQIEKISSHIEKQLYRSLKNKELILLLDLEKSLVYFSTSLKSSEVTIEKLLRGRFIKIYEEDKDLFDDVIIEFKQAIEMANIYSNILSGTMDAFASVISNNLNVIMKVLTVITILMTIPTIVFSYYGMNVTDLPIPNFWFPVVLAGGITFIIWLILKIKKVF